MTKEVFVRISGLQAIAGAAENPEEDPIEILCAGTYYYRNGKHYVRFEEACEGARQITKTQIKWEDENRLEVSRRGPVSVRMVFEKNRTNNCIYETPFGRLCLGIYMEQMQIREQEDDICIRAKYTLAVNCEPLADCALSIRICPKEEGFGLMKNDLEGRST